MRRWKMTRRIALVAMAASLLGFTLAEAKKPDKPGGGGGKPGRTAYTLIALPDEFGATDLDGYGEAMSELRSQSGELLGVEVVGIFDGRAYDWWLDASGTVLSAAPLPLPAGADPQATTSDAKDVNDDGMVVGAAGVYPAMRPVAWLTPASVPIELPVFAGFEGRGYGIHVNNHGLAVGVLVGSDNTEYGVAWGIKTDGNVVGPEVLGLGDVWAPDVNDAGTVVARVNYQAQRWRVDWNGSTLSASAAEILTADVVDENGDLRTITLPRVTAINDHGDICGTYQPVPGSWYQAYLLTAAGVLIEMPKLVDNKRRGTANFHASCLNDAAEPQAVQVVGQAYIYDKRANVVVDPETPVIWQGDRATDLEAVTNQPDSQLWLKSFMAVSDAGWLAGFGWNANTDPRAIVLVPK